MSFVCDWCDTENGSEECLFCSWGNPCLGCEDWDMDSFTCRSNGACGRLDEEKLKE